MQPTRAASPPPPLDPGAQFVAAGEAREGEWIRLHLGESPFGASPAARAAALASLADTARYPDPARLDVADAVAAHWHVGRDRAAVGNGSDELVLLSALSLGRLDRPGLTTAGTFPGYRAALQAARRGVRELPLRDFRPDIDMFVTALGDAGIGYLCNPHNPSGAALARDELDAVVDAAARTRVPVVFDEAYMDFATAGTPSVGDRLADDAPVVALRTFSKAHGLAGLRVGYAVGGRDAIAALRRAQGVVPFSVNRAAQAAACAALADVAFIEHVRTGNATRRDWFVAELGARGYAWLPSQTNFVAVAVADSTAATARLEQEWRILTRDTAAFGFPGHLRVSIGEERELGALLDALGRL